MAGIQRHRGGDGFGAVVAERCGVVGDGVGSVGKLVSQRGGAGLRIVEPGGEVGGVGCDLGAAGAELAGPCVGRREPGREVGRPGVQRRRATDQPLLGVAVVEAGDQLIKAGLQGRDAGTGTGRCCAHGRDACGELVRTRGQLLCRGEGCRIGQLGCAGGEARGPCGELLLGCVEGGEAGAELPVGGEDGVDGRPAARERGGTIGEVGSAGVDLPDAVLHGAGSGGEGLGAGGGRAGRLLCCGEVGGGSSGVAGAER